VAEKRELSDGISVANFVILLTYTFSFTELVFLKRSIEVQHFPDIAACVYTKALRMHILSIIDLLRTTFLETTAEPARFKFISNASLQLYDAFGHGIFIGQDPYLFFYIGDFIGHQLSLAAGSKWTADVASHQKLSSKETDDRDSADTDACDRAKADEPERLKKKMKIDHHLVLHEACPTVPFCATSRQELSVLPMLNGPSQYLESDSTPTSQLPQMFTNGFINQVQNNLHPKSSFYSDFQRNEKRRSYVSWSTPEKTNVLKILRVLQVKHSTFPFEWKIRNELDAITGSVFRTKTREQVRHYYYRTLKSVTKVLEDKINVTLDLKDTDVARIALIWHHESLLFFTETQRILRTAYIINQYQLANPKTAPTIIENSYITKLEI